MCFVLEDDNKEECIIQYVICYIMYNIMLSTVLLYFSTVQYNTVHVKFLSSQSYEKVIFK